MNYVIFTYDYLKMKELLPNATKLREVEFKVYFANALLKLKMPLQKKGADVCYNNRLKAYVVDEPTLELFTDDRLQLVRLLGDIPNPDIIGYITHEHFLAHPYTACEYGDTIKDKRRIAASLFIKSFIDLREKNKFHEVR